tara:strand:- start:164 stop:265 length:102 start_codon:yes stop_codon:yes gene_type:complete
MPKKAKVSVQKWDRHRCTVLNKIADRMREIKMP